MDYIEIKCRISPVDTGSEILTALLGEIGCDSFMEWEEGLLAYIPEAEFSESALKAISLPDNSIQWSYEINKVEDQDWNALWESNYDPVWIEDQCYIHAPFHPKEKAAYDILIEPKMSFGTAHHETTSLMLSMLLHTECNGKRVLDMGCGTAVLAILSKLRGASQVVAIDNDEWAYRNSLENCSNNQMDDIRCLLGDAKSIPDQKFDIILANINRNILLNDMAEYITHLEQGGSLFMSGFYEGDDRNAIQESAEKQHLTYAKHKTKNNWVAIHFKKV